MTEYDFSQEAIDAYLLKQSKISNWVDNTNRHPPANPFTPATPAVRALQMRQDDEDRRHRRRDSRDSKHRERNRDRDRERFVDQDINRHHRSTSPKSTKPRNRSASYSATTAVHPDPAKSRHVPPPLPLGPYPNGYLSTSQLPSPTHSYGQWGHQKLSPRDSKHSSRTSSSTWLPNGHQQNAPHSAPVIPKNVVRSHTTPASYGYQIHPAYQSGSMGYLPNAPQLPYSHYQPKPQPLLKRLFMSLGSGSNANKPKTPRRKRSSSF